ncbi:hypothetical protein GPECTOR_38g336 [Gonium pectorale]|uniref:Uncharacterized protein n=1 Tax=Gonium pectorale TaxID=33097 RepID=A0A150GB95_GONPE|nr:hypothetical protein GPECTOR_38g336 [Gonium pectorale]|eukprot:KXZ47099.1 hypothetical protein GPECTOR_38g336 [Gonium pectorale]
MDNGDPSFYSTPCESFTTVNAAPTPRPAAAPSWRRVGGAVGNASSGELRDAAQGQGPVAGGDAGGVSPLSRLGRSHAAAAPSPSRRQRADVLVVEEDGRGGQGPASNHWQHWDPSGPASPTSAQHQHHQDPHLQPHPQLQNNPDRDAGGAGGPTSRASAATGHRPSSSLLRQATANRLRAASAAAAAVAALPGGAHFASDDEEGEGQEAGGSCYAPRPASDNTDHLLGQDGDAASRGGVQWTQSGRSICSADSSQASRQTTRSDTGLVPAAALASGADGVNGGDGDYERSSRPSVATTLLRLRQEAAARSSAVVAPKQRLDYVPEPSRKTLAAVASARRASLITPPQASIGAGGATSPPPLGTRPSGASSAGWMTARDSSAGGAASDCNSCDSGGSDGPDAADAGGHNEDGLGDRLRIVRSDFPPSTLLPPAPHPSVTQVHYYLINDHDQPHQLSRQGAQEGEEEERPLGIQQELGQEPLLLLPEELRAAERAHVFLRNKAVSERIISRRVGHGLDELDPEEEAADRVSGGGRLAAALSPKKQLARLGSLLRLRERGRAEQQPLAERAQPRQEAVGDQGSPRLTEEDLRNHQLLLLLQQRQQQQHQQRQRQSEEAYERHYNNRSHHHHHRKQQQGDHMTSPLAPPTPHQVHGPSSTHSAPLPPRPPRPARESLGRQARAYFQNVEQLKAQHRRARRDSLCEPRPRDRTSRPDSDSEAALPAPPPLPHHLMRRSTVSGDSMAAAAAADTAAQRRRQRHGRHSIEPVYRHEPDGVVAAAPPPPPPSRSRVDQLRATPSMRQKSFSHSGDMSGPDLIEPLGPPDGAMRPQRATDSGDPRVGRPERGGPAGPRGGVASGASADYSAVVWGQPIQAPGPQMAAAAVAVAATSSLAGSQASSGAARPRLAPQSGWRAKVESAVAAAYEGSGGELSSGNSVGRGGGVPMSGASARGPGAGAAAGSLPYSTLYDSDPAGPVPLPPMPPTAPPLPLPPGAIQTPREGPHPQLRAPWEASHADKDWPRLRAPDTPERAPAAPPRLPHGAPGGAAAPHPFHHHHLERERDRQQQARRNADCAGEQAWYLDEEEEERLSHGGHRGPASGDAALEEGGARLQAGHAFTRGAVRTGAGRQPGAVAGSGALASSEGARAGAGSVGSNVFDNDLYEEDEGEEWDVGGCEWERRRGGYGGRGAGGGSGGYDERGDTDGAYHDDYELPRRVDAPGYERGGGGGRGRGGASAAVVEPMAGGNGAARALLGPAPPSGGGVSILPPDQLMAVLLRDAALKGPTRGMAAKMAAKEKKGRPAAKEEALWF